MKPAVALALSALASGLMVSSAQAQAAAPEAHDAAMYAEVGYSAIQARTTDGPDRWKASTGLVTGAFGYQFHPNMAVEGLLGFGAGRGSLKYNGVATGDSVKLGSVFGVYFRPRVALGDSAELFGRVGWARTEVRQSSTGKDSDDGVSYGIGGRYHLTQASYLQADWTRFYDRRHTSIDGFGFAYGMRF